MSINTQSLQRISQLTVVALAALLTVMAVVALASRQKGHLEITSLLNRYTDAEKPANQQDPKETGEAKKEDAPDPRIDRISKRHAFSPEKKPGEFSAKLIGVLGHSAFFEGENKAIKVGDSFRDATLKKIGADWVEFDFKGKPKKLFVFGAGKDSGSPSAPPGAPGPSGPPGRPGSSMRRPPSVIKGGMELSPEMIERFKSMPQEMREKATKRMPAELRKKLEEEL